MEPEDVPTMFSSSLSICTRIMDRGSDLGLTKDAAFLH